MLAIALHGRDLTVVALLAAFLCLLLYRLFRSEPNTRIVRFGIFVERARIVGDNPGEEITERAEWPKRKEEP